MTPVHGLEEITELTTESMVGGAPPRLSSTFQIPDLISVIHANWRLLQIKHEQKDSNRPQPAVSEVG